MLRELFSALFEEKNQFEIKVASYFLYVTFWHIAKPLTKAQINVDGFQIYLKFISVCLHNTNTM